MRGLEVCLPTEFLSQGLEEGFCGKCPTEMPSASPTGFPTAAPTPTPSTQAPSSGPSDAPTTLEPTIDTSTPNPTSAAPTSISTGGLKHRGGQAVAARDAAVGGDHGV